MFVLFTVSLSEMTDDPFLRQLGSMFWVFFLYGPYLDLIQIPLSVLALFIKSRPRRWGPLRAADVHFLSR